MKGHNFKNELTALPYLIVLIGFSPQIVGTAANDTTTLPMAYTMDREMIVLQGQRGGNQLVRRR